MGARPRELWCFLVAIAVIPIHALGWFVVMGWANGTGFTVGK
jgi:hypothetical protein